MQIAAGTRIGPYEVLSFLGAGGMGEVYRARDPRLGREVAIKLLPSQFVADPERLRRFEQEARAAGMLSHPNILTVFDIGKENDTVYVVSELLAGETLRERLGGAPMSPRKAVETALQIAHGLAAAHEKGIVHRDLKPENIFLTKDGRVKILDFGLAKLADPFPGMGKSELQTVDPGTKPGIVLGTVGYMSPEQVRARDIDHRSDVFSFGAILYEMLSGKRAFVRDSTADTMSAILKEDPPEVSGVVSGVPPSLERVMRHCLEKNPEQRFQSARDLAFDLEMVSGISTASAAQPAEIRKSPGRAIQVGLALLAIVLALGAAYSMGRRASRNETVPSVKAVAPPSFKRLTFRRGFVTNARFTADGQSVVYSASWLGAPEELFVTRPQNPVSRALGITDASILSISRAGEMAVLLHPRFTVGWQRIGTLARAPIDGGAPREILNDVQDADFSPDGQQFAVSHAVDGRYQLEFPIGKVLFQTDGWLNYVQVSPDGKSIAFMEHGGLGDDRGTVNVVDLAGKVTRLTDAYASESGLHWSRDGKEIWFSGSPEGSNEQPVYAVTMQKQLRVVTSMAGNLVLTDIDAKGNVLLNRDSRRREIIALPPGETQERDLSWFDWSFPRYLSEDGKLLVFEEQGAGGGVNYTVFIRNTDGSPAIKLGEGFAGDLSPDGKYALSQLPSQPGAIILLPTGAGESRKISNPGYAFQSIGTKWFQDNKRLVISARKLGTGNRWWILDLATEKLQPLTPEGITGTVLITPDQSSVLVNAGQGHFNFYSVNGGPPRPASGFQPGDVLIRWTTDGRGVFVGNGRGIPYSIYKVDIAGGTRTLWKEITPPDVAGIVSIISVVMTPDGKSYAYTFRRALSDLYMATGLK